MQLNIKIDLLQNSLSSPVGQQAPFDPVKIRIFLLVVITLISLIGFGVYNMWFEDEKSALNSIVNTQSNTTSKKITPKVASAGHTLADNPIHTKELNVIDKSLAPANDPNVSVETNHNEKLLAVNEPNNVPLSLSNPLETSKVETSITEIENDEPKNVNVINRAQLTTNVEAREPTNTIEVLNLQEHTKLYFFTEVHNKNNHKIVHRWIFMQKTMAEKTLNIGSDQWRTYSSKNFDETMIGQWVVQVVDANNTILKTIGFEVVL